MNRNLMQQRMRIFIGLSLFIFLLELVGGWYTNSLALISDAMVIGATVRNAEDTISPTAKTEASQ